MKKDFIERLKTLDLHITKEQYEQFETYYTLLIEWNNKINLTAITEKKDVFLKHFYDSLCFVKGVKLSNQSILDIGSGAGFPSIPLKIMFPNLNITIIDALQKRIKFLDTLSKSLNIDIELIHGRAENLDQKESFDIVTARAVAPLNILSELCLPFVRLHGLFLPLKGNALEEEVNKSFEAIKTLGGEYIKSIEYTYDDNTRTLAYIRKIKSTPKEYPRSFNKIKKKPL